MSDKIDVSAQVTVTDEATGPIESVQRALVGLANQARRMTEGFKSTLGKGAFGGIIANLQSTRSAFGQLHGQVNSVLKPITALMGITGGISFAGTVAGMKDVAKEAVTVGKAAKQLGIENMPETMDAWRFAAGKAGMEFDEFVAIIGKGDLQLRKASTGTNKNLAALLKMPGDLIAPIAKGVAQGKPAILMLEDIVKLVSAQKNVGVQRDIMTALFGKGGMAMLPLIQRGPEGVKALLDRAKELSLFTKQNVADAKAFNLAYGRSRDEVTDLGEDIAKELIPKFTPLLKMIGDVVVLLKPEIFTAVTGAIDEFSKSLEGVKAEDVVAGMKEWWTWGKRIYTMLGGWKTIMTGIALFMAGPWIVAMGTATVAIATLSAAILTNPIGIAAVAIAGAAYLIYRNWAFLKPGFVNIWNGIKYIFETVKGWWTAFVGLFTPENFMKVWRPIAAFFGWVWGRAKAAFATAWEWLKYYIDLFVPDAIKDAWNAVVPIFGRVWDGITDAIVKAWGVIKPIIDSMRDGMQWIIDHLPGTAPAPGTPPGTRSPATQDFNFDVPGGGTLPAPVPQRQGAYQNPWIPMPSLADATAATARKDELTVTVNFENAPEWLRKPDIDTSSASRGIRTSVNVGYSMAFSG